MAQGQDARKGNKLGELGKLRATLAVWAFPYSCPLHVHQMQYNRAEVTELKVKHLPACLRSLAQLQL